MTLRVAYIISQYPEFHETFVAREVEALRLKGVSLTIFSLKTPTEEELNLYPEHASFIVVSSFFASIPLVLANIKEAVRCPLRYLRAFTWIIAAHRHSFLEMLKAIAVFPKTVLYAHKMRGTCDLLHAHWATIPASMSVVVSILTGIKFSITAHAWDIFLSPQSLLREKIARACGVVTCTGYNVKYLKGLCREEDIDKIHLNYHGLDFGKFPLPENRTDDRPTFKIIAVGRLVEQKGFIHLIRAVSLLAERGISIHLTIVGVGPLLQVLQEEAKHVPHAGLIEFTGRMSHGETIARMMTSHLFAAPSVIAGDGDRDGIPNVILEAMACSVPVVASAVSGIPEVVIDGNTGCLVPPGDYEVLADTIARLVQNQDLAAQLADNGRRFVEQYFDVSENVNSFIGLLDSFAAVNDGLS